MEICYLMFNINKFYKKEYFRNEVFFLFYLIIYNYYFDFFNIFKNIVLKNKIILIL